MDAVGSTNSPPCASCKLLRRRCAADCVFAPYFPTSDLQRFAVVHRVFGSSNVMRMLLEIPAAQRADAVSSLVFEANARRNDPVYGCAGAISSLLHHIGELQAQLALARAQIRHTIHHTSSPSTPSPAAPLLHLQQQLDHHQHQHQHQHQQQQQQHQMEMGIMENDLMMNMFNDAAHHGQAMMGYGYGPSGNAMMLQEGCLKKESLWT